MLLSAEDEEVVLDFIINDISLADIITLPHLNCPPMGAGGGTIKKPYLCPHCGKMLSGLTSYRPHLVSLDRF